MRWLRLRWIIKDPRFPQRNDTTVQSRKGRLSRAGEVRVATPLAQACVKSLVLRKPLVRTLCSKGPLARHLPHLLDLLGITEQVDRSLGEFFVGIRQHELHAGTYPKSFDCKTRCDHRLAC